MGQIYFIQCRDDGPVKIGYAGHAPEKRLAALQTGSADPLHLRFVIPGTVRLERAIHAAMEDLRLRGEWFMPCHDFLDRVRVSVHMAGPMKSDGASIARPAPNPRWLQEIVEARARLATDPTSPAAARRPGRPTEIGGVLGELVTQVGGVSALAKIMGVDRRTVLRWHRGERKPGGPVKAFLKELAETSNDRGSIPADGAR